MKKFKIKINRGMSYVELIVVLSIFAVLSSVSIFNYGDFQARVDIKNLASDIALKIVEAQKSSLNGVLPATYPADWKPSYGVYFNSSVSSDTDDIAFNKKFIYFANLDAGNFYDTSFDFILDQPVITKNNYISGLEVVGAGCPAITTLDIVFRRPDSRALITSGGVPLSCASFVQINIASPKGATASIRIYPSGRAQVN